MVIIQKFLNNENDRMSTFCFRLHKNRMITRKFIWRDFKIDIYFFNGAIFIHAFLYRDTCQWQWEVWLGKYVSSCFKY